MCKLHDIKDLVCVDYCESPALRFILGHRGSWNLPNVRLSHFRSLVSPMPIELNDCFILINVPKFHIKSLFKFLWFRKKGYVTYDTIIVSEYGPVSS